MEKWVLITGFATAALALSIGASLLEQRVEMEWIFAYATPTRGSAAVSGTCSDTPVTAFAPSLDYTLSFSAPTAAAAATCSSSLSLLNAVNGDTEPSPRSCSTSNVDGFAVIGHRTPTIKMGGLVCTTEDRATLQVNGDGSDNVNMDIAISTVGSSDWDSAKKVDDAPSASPDMLFGSGGQVGTTAIIDGSDYDGLTNGEVAFGGTTASQGASRFYIKVGYTNRVVSWDTDQETLTFTLTPQ